VHSRQQESKEQGFSMHHQQQLAITPQSRVGSGGVPSSPDLPKLQQQHEAGTMMDADRPADDVSRGRQDLGGESDPTAGDGFTLLSPRAFGVTESVALSDEERRRGGSSSSGWLSDSPPPGQPLTGLRQVSGGHTDGHNLAMPGHTSGIASSDLAAAYAQWWPRHSSSQGQQQPLVNTASQGLSSHASMPGIVSQASGNLSAHKMPMQSIAGSGAQLAFTQQHSLDSAVLLSQQPSSPLIGRQSVRHPASPRRQPSSLSRTSVRSQANSEGCETAPAGATNQAGSGTPPAGKSRFALSVAVSAFKGFFRASDAARSGNADSNDQGKTSDRQHDKGAGVGLHNHGRRRLSDQQPQHASVTGPSNVTLGRSSARCSEEATTFSLATKTPFSGGNGTPEFHAASALSKPCSPASMVAAAQLLLHSSNPLYNAAGEQEDGRQLQMGAASLEYSLTPDNTLPMHQEQEQCAEQPTASNYQPGQQAYNISSRVAEQQHHGSGPSFNTSLELYPHELALSDSIGRPGLPLGVVPERASMEMSAMKSSLGTESMGSPSPSLMATSVTGIHSSNSQRCQFARDLSSATNRVAGTDAGNAIIGRGSRLQQAPGDSSAVARLDPQDGQEDQELSKPASPATCAPPGSGGSQPQKMLPPALAVPSFPLLPMPPRGASDGGITTDVGGKGDTPSGRSLDGAVVGPGQQHLARPGELCQSDQYTHVDALQQRNLLFGSREQNQLQSPVLNVFAEKWPIPMRFHANFLRIYRAPHVAGFVAACTLGQRT
jgi:hypothetical protein